MSSDEISKALENLREFKEGNAEATTPTTNSAQVPQTEDALEIAKREVDRLFNARDLTALRAQVDVAVANWDRRNGYCKYNVELGTKRRFGKRMNGLNQKYGSHVIAINEKILEDGNREGFLDTVRHELAHVEAYERFGESQGHNHEWKNIARELGADDSSCHNKKETQYKYFIACPECEWTGGKHRRSKKIKEPFNRVCNDCRTRCVSYEAGDPMPEEPGVCAVESIPWDNKDEYMAHPSKQL